MFSCPYCHAPLNKQRIPPLGLVWICPACQGRAMTLDLLRKTIPKSLIDHLWQQARVDDHHTGRRCPACERQMAEVPIIPGENKTICPDVCTTCYFVWFDPHEFEALPKLGPKSSDFEGLSEEAKRALALARLELLKQERLTPEMEALDMWRRWQIALDVLGIVIRILTGS